MTRNDNLTVQAVPYPADQSHDNGNLKQQSKFGQKLSPSLGVFVRRPKELLAVRTLAHKRLLTLCNAHN
jgi:hypothetical protein